MPEFTGGLPQSEVAFRLLLSAVMKRCAKSRQQISDELSVKSGRAVSLSTLNDYTATTKATARFPAVYLGYFCEVIGDDALLRFLLTPRLLALIELGESFVAGEKSRGEREKLLRGLLDAEMDR